MNYLINPSAFSAVFTVPCEVADRHLRLAGETQLKVLLFVLRNLSAGISAGAAAEALGLPESEAEDALLYWQQAGIFSAEQAAPAPACDPAPAPVRTAARPSRADVAQRGMEDEKVSFLMREAQQRFGRSLKSNEASSLLWLYDDQGMDVSVILMLLQYAASVEKLNISFLEKTALVWLKNGVKTVADAEQQIAEDLRHSTAWQIVQTAFGMKRRSPSPKEAEKADRWINEWKLPRELLHCAYNVCVDQKSEFIFSYAAKVLEDWHKRGICTPEDVEQDAKRRADEKNKETKRASYDLEAFERMLNADD